MLPLRLLCCCCGRNAAAVAGTLPMLECTFEARPDHTGQQEPVILASLILLLLLLLLLLPLPLLLPVPLLLLAPTIKCLTRLAGCRLRCLLLPSDACQL